MNARVLFILLVISVLLAFTQRYRKAGLGLSAVLALLLVWFNIRLTPNSETLVATPSSSAASSVTIITPAAQLLALQLSGSGAPWHLTGGVQNISNTTIRSVSLNIERVDCPAADALAADCLLLWQGVHVLHINIPAAASAKVDESFYSHGTVPRLTGVARDRITIMKVE